MSCDRSQATRGMSGLNARCALLAANTASSAGTVAVGSAMGTSSVLRRVVARGFDRVDPTRRAARLPPSFLDPLLVTTVYLPARRRLFGAGGAHCGGGTPRSGPRNPP